MRVFFITSAFVVAVDQGVKFFIRHLMKLNSSVEILKDNILRITYIENSGISFGIFGSDPHPYKRWILLGIIFGAMAVIFVYWKINRTGKILYDFSCGLILGGAMGNYIDRVLTGRVVDFIEVGYKNHTFPVFNAADSAVTVGVALFIIHMLFTKEKKDAPGAV